MTVQHKELITLSLLLFVFLIALVPSLIDSRTLIRDDLRQQDINHLKRALENYYNKHNFYVTPPSEKEACTSSTEADSWFFGPQSVLLKEKIVRALPHDVRESKGYEYTYCVTALDNQKTSGYVLQARLEGSGYQEGSYFDEDEARKYHFRIRKDKDQILYYVCGGTNTQCQ